jgi:chaperone LolA
MRTVFTLALCLTVLTAATSTQTPDALARALEQRYQGIKDFSADFVQVYRGGVLKTQSREEGKVSIKKPGRMRWTYVKPEKKEFVSDGTKVYSYIPLDQRVTVNQVPPANEATTPALFLAGNGDIVRDFTSAAAEPAVPGTVFTPWLSTANPKMKPMFPVCLWNSVSVWCMGGSHERVMLWCDP